MGSFESLLEKQYILLMDFDDMVEGFEEQPVNIPVTITTVEGIQRAWDVSSRRKVGTGDCDVVTT